MEKTESQFWQPNPEHSWWQPNDDHLAKLMEGVAAWNTWRDEYPGVGPILRKANLTKANLRGANLSNVDFGRSSLSGADLSKANLYQAEFFAADLRGAYLTEADLRGAKFHLADLRGADLQRSDLFRVDFISSRLDFAKLSHARCMTTAFTDVDLSEVFGLEDVLHTGPSGIDVSTLLKCKKTLPREFLRGAGIPDNIIEMIPTLVDSDEVSQFYSSFISYNRQDEGFAKRLYLRIRDAHLRVWFAPEHIAGGEKIHEQIDRAIKTYDKLLIVLSEHSLQSNWVMTELRKARRSELVEGRRKLFPDRLVSYEKLQEWECFDADSGKDLAIEVREYFIPDFSDWKDNNSFEVAFKRLLKDLKTTEVACA